MLTAMNRLCGQLVSGKLLIEPLSDHFGRSRAVVQPQDKPESSRGSDRYEVSEKPSIATLPSYPGIHPSQRHPVPSSPVKAHDDGGLHELA